MKKILLFADVGGHEYEEYYHVGDEAMLYETYSWYKKQHPDWQLSVVSWFKTHHAFDAVEIPHLHWRQKGSALYFPQLVFKLFCWKVLRTSLFNQTELTLVKHIAEQDRIHFTGGGNLSSQFRPWLYYCFFVILVARLNGVHVVLTSQTIGPIAGVDYIFSFFILNLCHLIAVRSRLTKMQLFKQCGVLLPKLQNMLDAAYTLPPQRLLIKTKSKKLYIGLSIHAWKDWENQTAQLIRKLVRAVGRKYAISLVLIPHHITLRAVDPDTAYMQRNLAALPNNTVRKMPAMKIANKTLLASQIKKRTAEVDLLITTRYHGIVFGLSAGVPTIALHLDEYYRSKNAGALEMFFGKAAASYQVGIKDINSFEQLLNKTTSILENLIEERALVKKVQKQIVKTHKTLDSVMAELDAAFKVAL